MFSNVWIIWVFERSVWFDSKSLVITLKCDRSWKAPWWCGLQATDATIRVDRFLLGGAPILAKTSDIRSIKMQMATAETAPPYFWSGPNDQNPTCIINKLRSFKFKHSTYWLITIERPRKESFHISSLQDQTTLTETAAPLAKLLSHSDLPVEYPLFQSTLIWV